MNTIFVIQPFFDNGIWLFNDESRKIVREPFIGVTNLIIDWMVRNIPEAKKGFNLLFSDSPFPDYQLKLYWVRHENEGDIYESDLLGAQGWLCSVLLAYFPKAPKILYAKAEE